MLDDVMHRKVDKTKIGFLVRFHQPFAKVIDRRKAIVVVRLGKVRSVKDGVAVNGARVVDTFEKFTVDQLHLVSKQGLKQIQTPTATHIATTLATVDACFRS